MTPEDAVGYLEHLSRRLGLGELDEKERNDWIMALRDNRDPIESFIQRAELNIERAAAMKKEKAA